MGKRFLKVTGIMIGLILVISLMTLPAGAAKVRVRVLCFAQGFAWPELFGTSGVEETERLKEFEEKEGIDIQIEWGDETAVRQKVAADLAAGTGRYDLVLVGTDGGVQTYGYGGFLEPLDKYFQRYPSEYFDPKDVYPQFLNANRVEGVLYALPYYSFGAGIMYRKDIFDRYGLTPPETSDQLYQVLEGLKSGLEGEGITDVYPLTMRGAPGEEPTLDLAGFVYAWAGYPAWFEGGAITPQEIKEKKAMPIFIQDFAPGFSAFVELCQKYGPPGISTHTWVDMMNLYAMGKAVILMPSAINAYAALGITEDENVKKYTRFAKIPTGPGGKQIQSFWTFSLGINKDSKHKKEAWRVLTFLMGKESMQAFAERTRWPNVTMKSVLYSDVLIKKYGMEEIRLNEESILEANPFYFPYIPELNEYMDRIGTAASEAIAKTRTVEEVLSGLQTWALETMLRAGYYR
jgi:ABC-type glycerol-3-phosphate transport system substrate-binding protein